MKKIIINSIALLLSHSLLAQWHAGGSAGVTFSNYKTKTPWKEVSNTGITVGVTAYRQMNLHWGVNIDLAYIQKGYTHKICNSISDELNANYLEIPVRADYGFLIPGIRNFKGHFAGGFYASYWLNGKYKTKGFDGGSEAFDFKKQGAKRFDFGPTAGARIEYVMRNGSVSVTFRYEVGLLDLQKKVEDNTRNTNRSVVIGLMYMKMLRF